MLEHILRVGKGDIQRQRNAAGQAALTLAPDGKSFTLEFTLDEQIDLNKLQAPPDEQLSNEWALCEVVEGWPGRRPAKAAWRFKVTVPVPEGALKAQGW